MPFWTPLDVAALALGRSMTSPRVNKLTQRLDTNFHPSAVRMNRSRSSPTHPVADDAHRYTVASGRGVCAAVPIIGVFVRAHQSAKLVHDLRRGGLCTQGKGGAGRTR